MTSGAIGLNWTYWMGVAGAPNGSVGAAGPVICHTVFDWFTANERVPVVP